MLIQAAAKRAHRRDQGVQRALRRTVCAARSLVDDTCRRRIARQLSKGEDLHALRRHHQQQTELIWCLTLLPTPSSPGPPNITAKLPAPAVSDGAPLTPPELQVARLIAGGRSNKEITAGLVISQRTAEGHVERILVRIGFTSRAQVAAWVAESPTGW